MYARNSVNILVLLLVFSMNPIIILYISKYNYLFNTLIFSLLNLFLFYFLIHKSFKISLPRPFIILLISHIIIVVITFIMYNKITHELLFFSYFIEILVLVYLLVDDTSFIIKKIFLIIKILLVLNLIVFIAINILHLSYSQISLNINGEYVKYHFNYMGFVLNHQEKLFGLTLHRVYSYFSEPAQFATFLVFIIIIAKLNGYKGSLKLFWINGILGLSMMFYVFIFIYIFFLNIKKIQAIFVVIIMSIIQILIAIWLINDIGLENVALFFRGNIDSSNAILMKAGSLISRLEFFINNISSLFISPIGIGYPDNMDQILLLNNNIVPEGQYFYGIRSPTGLLSSMLAMGGIWLLILFLYTIYKIEKAYKNNKDAIYLLRAGIVFFTLLSTSSFFSPIVAVLIALTYKRYSNPINNNLNKNKNKKEIKYAHQ